MEQTRIAVLGVYRSGSTVIAGVLHHLGVDMGSPFFEGFYESAKVSEQLRRWWNEPYLRERVGQAKRIRVLAEWIRERESGGPKWVGLKHPLLSLSCEDLVQAWGEETRFIRCCRPIEDSIDSLKRLGRTVEGEAIQRALLATLDRFFEGREHLAIEFADMMSNPRHEIERLRDYLQIPADPEKLAAAVRFVEPGARSKVEREQGERLSVVPGFKRRGLWGSLRKAVLSHH